MRLATPDPDYHLLELMREDAMNRLYRARLRANPNCRDPDHPGCNKCWDEIEREIEDDFLHA